MTIPFHYQPLFQNGPDPTEYRLLTDRHVGVESWRGREYLLVEPVGLRLLAREAFHDIAFYLRRRHLDQLAAILDDPESSANDRYVATTLLRNAVEAANGVLPGCQDTGTAIVVAHKGEAVLTGDDDRRWLSKGIFETYHHENLRYSQMAPLSMFEEVNTGTNLPAQIDIHATTGDEYHFLCIAKGGGSANKTFLYQETKSLLTKANLTAFCAKALPRLGTTACPPYHIALVIGGTSAEENLKTVKLASTGYYDQLPTSGDRFGRAFRDLEWEEKILQLARETGIGAQFGGKYLAHDVRVIRLPRHAASNPVGLAVSCSADRNIKAKITKEGIFVEQLVTDLAPYRRHLERHPITAQAVAIDLNRPMSEILAQLAPHPPGTLLHLTGPLIVARDIAHARINEMLDRGEPMPDYFRDHPVYYAGPAKTPQGLVSGSFGPTTAGRMDVYVDRFQAAGGSLVMLAKGNRSPEVTAACKRHGGFYLGSIGGPAAVLARECITAMEVVAFEDLGMEAVRRIEVRDFPAFVICDNQGHDLFDTFGRKESS